jgi:predicted dehydrogenase
MGPVVAIQAHTATLAHERIEVEDTAVATLRFESGALGIIEATTAAYPGYLKRIEISGSHGTAVLEEEDLTVWDFAKRGPGDAAILKTLGERTSTGGGASDPAAIGHHGHAKQFREFVDAVKYDRTPAIDGREGRKSVEIILAIYKAAETGRTVELPLKSDPVLKARRKS